MSRVNATTRRAISLGGTDPRSRRPAQIPVVSPLGLDEDGRLTLAADGEKPGDIALCQFKGWAAWDGLAVKVTDIKTAAYTARMGEVVRCNPTGGAFTVTLPTSAGAPGKVVIVKNASASATAITVDGAGSETIDGAATTSIAAGYGSLTLMSDGQGAWMVL